MREARPRRTLSITQLVVLLSAGATIIALAVVFGVSGYVRDRALQDLARNEARQTSLLVFESLYSAMRKGWTKAEIGEVILRLQRALPDLTIRVVRGEPVIGQFGEIDGDRALAAADADLRQALTDGDEKLLAGEQSIRYLYPLKVKAECRVCHTDARIGQVNGVIDIIYPVRALKVSLDFVLNTALLYFFAVLALLSITIYIKLKLFIARPIVQLVGLMKEIIQHADLSRRLDTGGKWITEVANLTEYFNRLLGTVQDYHSQLEELSIRDPLTKLYNRRKFEEFVDHEIDRSTRHQHQFCLVMLDIDNFKHINDTFGHPIGDLALRELARLLNRETRRSDLLARLGGDEFAVILPETDYAQGRQVAEKLRQTVAETAINLPVGDTRIAASFGLVSFPDNGADLQRLVIAMDVALYKAKRGGKNQVAGIDHGEEMATMAVFGQGEFLRSALAEDRVVAHLQPIVASADGTVMAYEVLARVDDGSTAVTAGQFIEAAEELGLAAEIDRRVFEKGLALLASGGLGQAKVFFNLSARTLSDTGRMRAVPARLAELGVDPGRVVFEITEREALPRFHEVIGLVNDLRAQGIAFALDDFGSGFSSFLYLKYLTIDYVKIEGSFVRNMVRDERDRIVVEQINVMAKRFGLVTIGEFVEDAETLAMLRRIGVDWCQGYHCGMPQLVAADA